MFKFYFVYLPQIRFHVIVHYDGDDVFTIIFVIILITYYYYYALHIFN